MEETQDLILKWASEKGLVNPVKQTLKTLSEAGELADAVCKSNLDQYHRMRPEEIEKYDDIIDAIGDIEVCLTILKRQLHLDQDQCIKVAYDVIKNRTGKTLNGTFVKD